MSQSKTTDRINLDSLFSELLTEYKDKVYGLASKYFKDRADREDIVQETFLRVYACIHQIDKNRNVGALIFRIGTNLCIDTLRKKAVRQKVINIPLREIVTCDVMDLFPSKEKSPEEAALSNEMWSQIEKVISELPSKWRPYIYQKCYLGLTLDEMSTVNNLPVTTIKTRLYRAKMHIQEKLDGQVCL